MKLISMAEFVLEQFKELLSWKISEQIYILRVTEYAKFLSQPLTLGMFVPCVDNVPLEEPINFYSDSPIKEESKMYQNLESVKKYNKAKENVLFEGFEVLGYDNDFCELELKNADLWIKFIGKEIEVTNQFNQEYSIYTIEDLIQEDLTLTESAKQQLKQ